MAEATFRHGDPLMIDYTPTGGDVDAGDIVLLGNTAGLQNGIAHRDIANNTKGALAVGEGVYHCQVASNYAAWTTVYKPAGNAILTTTSTNNTKFGYTLEAAAAANATIEVLHDPR